MTYYLIDEQYFFNFRRYQSGFSFDCDFPVPFIRIYEHSNEIVNVDYFISFCDTCYSSVIISISNRNILPYGSGSRFSKSPAERETMLALRKDNLLDQARRYAVQKVLCRCIAILNIASKIGEVFYVLYFYGIHLSNIVVAKHHCLHLLSVYRQSIAPCFIAWNLYSVILFISMLILCLYLKYFNSCFLNILFRAVKLTHNGHINMLKD